MLELRAAAERLLALLNNIMDASQLESGNVIEKFTNFSIHELLGNIVTCFKPYAGNLATQLPEQRQDITSAFEKHDYEKLEYHVHKLHGGTCYCGVPKLRLAAKRFEYILRAKQLKNIAAHFNQLMIEIEAFLNEWYKLKSEE